ncbi:MAG: tripartite tricarboxylate transporter TctB family protein [Sulfitobacter sp.]
MSRMSDRIFGLAVILVALVYIASATQIQASFLSDPVGSKTFPILVASIAAICGGVMILRPDAEPDWPEGWTLVSVLICVLLLIIYSYALKPLGFLIPTALVSGAISYQILPKARFAALTGVGLSIGLLILFKVVLGLGIRAFGTWLAF